MSSTCSQIAAAAAEEEEEKARGLVACEGARFVTDLAAVLSPPPSRPCMLTSLVEGYRKEEEEGK